MTTRAPRMLGMLPGILREARLAWRLWRDRRVPLWVKGVPLLSLAYVLFPFDFLADPVLGLGQLDDLGVILLGLSLFISLAPNELVAEYRGETVVAEAPEGEHERPPVRTTYRFVDGDEPPA